jgi:hypothetical protein
MAESAQPPVLLSVKPNILDYPDVSWQNASGREVTGKLKVRTLTETLQLTDIIYVSVGARTCPVILMWPSYR